MSEPYRLPDIHRVSLAAPLVWLQAGFNDLKRAPGPCLAYGFGLTLLSLAITAVLYVTGQFTWFLVLAGGFMIIAPMLGLGLYRAASMLEKGEMPTLGAMLSTLFTPRADGFLLGVALFVLFGIWAEAAYIIYGLSTFQVHQSVVDFLGFLLLTPEGWQMALIGSCIGGVIAFIAFALVVVSAPMMLEEGSDAFLAVITSVRSVLANLPAMLVWAFLITLLTALGMALMMIGLVIVFPWIGLSSWHAYRHLVLHTSPLAG